MLLIYKMSTRDLFIKIANKQKQNKFKLLEDVNKDNNIENYYCANSVEKLFECENELIYKKNGAFGFNYRYCSNCYNKWNKLQLDKNK